MRKNAEINCLPQRCIKKKLSAETTYAMQDLGNLKKLSAQSEWRKKVASAQSMVKKNFLPPRNHDTSPRGGIMVRPLFSADSRAPNQWGKCKEMLYTVRKTCRKFNGVMNPADGWGGEGASVLVLNGESFYSKQFLAICTLSGDLSMKNIFSRSDLLS